MTLSTTPVCGDCVGDPKAMKRQMRSKWEGRYLGEDGNWYCGEHIGARGRGWHEKCTHSLGFNHNGRCTYCGMEEPRG